MAAAIDLAADGTIREARMALGGVAHKPWRARKAEAELRGAPATEDSFRAAAQAELAGAVGLRDNAFRIGLAQRVIAATLQDLVRNEGARP